VLNLYSNDGQRLSDGAYLLPCLLSGPLFLVGATVYAVTLIGAWALIGFVILLLMLPVQVGIAAASDNVTWQAGPDLAGGGPGAQLT